MKIYYLNGPRLFRAIRAGSDSVISRTEYLNKINVFPVADNDTGTNMALTLQSINRALANSSPSSIQDVGNITADSALMGAQGNSGVILAQFFYGFSENLNGKSKIKVKSFSKAVNNALDSAYQALSDPVEGTILDVMVAWAKAVEIASAKTQDFAELIKSSLEASRRALAETPKKMKLLADSGVVDAGAQGFVYFLEGINRYISSGRIEPPPTEFADIDIGHPNIEMAPENIKFQYCTECFITGTSMSKHDIKHELLKMGDSLIIAGSKEKIKIHIHSNEPDRVFEHLSNYGSVSNKKIDDMRAQHVAQFKTMENNNIAIVTDSSCDLPDAVLKELNVNVVSLRINFGTESYLDKSTMTTGEFYNMFEMADTPPTTSQPTPADFKKVYEKVSQSSKQIVSIHLSGAASGTLQSAQAVSRNIQDTVVTTIDSTTTSIALGLLVRFAAELLRDGKSYDEIIRLTKKMVPNTDIVIGINDVVNLIRSGRVPISKGIITRMLNLRPIITFDDEGKGKPISVSFGKKGILSKVFNLITKHSENYDNLRFAVVHTRSSKLAKKLEDRLKAHFNTEDIYIIEASPTLGAHAGMGALGAAFIGDPKA
ncbi:MAG: DegV family EDD domain-containing protein [Candidatus Marinimicrobia bacterium]|nr:DegV family EDD domain-containing protein [Candidatus Neomarinimicrobiota bacterium]